MKILSPRHTEAVESHEMFFANDKTGHSGYGFPCDAAGVIAPLGNDCARANLAKCLAGTNGILPGTLKTWVNHHTRSAVGLCECGTRVYLSGFTNTCDGCDADYNKSGQQLAPREVWGEDTGESLSEILAIP
jgi:hypothetical protein